MSLVRTRMVPLLCAVLVLAASAGTAQAATVTPVFYPNNPACASIDQDFGETWSELRIDPANPGTTNFDNGQISGSITIDANDHYMSFTASPGLDAVIMKGGPDAQVYVYDPDATSDTGLASPDNGGRPFGASHVSLCYNVTGSISGTKWHDLNGNGARDAGEPVLAGYVLYLDLDHDNAYTAGEPTATTSALGLYSFSDLALGAYEVREAPDAMQPASLQGFTCTSPAATCEHTAALTMAARNDAGNDFGNFKQPKLTVVKHVINDDGGSKVAGDFTMTIDDAGSNPPSFPGAESPGTTSSVDAGSYSVSETADPGYADSYSADCAGTLASGEHKTCTVTNDDKPGKIVVIKHVVNDDGGTKVASDFDIQAIGGSPSPAAFDGAEAPGTDVSIDAGAYDVTETEDPGYAASYSAGCSGTIANGETKTCTVTNDDRELGIDVEKKVSRSQNGPYADGPVHAYVGETVFFEMTVDNTGNSPLMVDFSDPKCDGATLGGPTGDGAPAGSLGVGETWTYRCSHVITAADLTAGTFDNVACATGMAAAGRSANDCDNAGAVPIEPAIRIDKTGPATAVAGTDVKYTLVVTNPGKLALVGETLKVTDPQCAAPPRLVGKSGGGGADSSPATLDPGDSWTYDCAVTTQPGQTKLVNVGKACGYDAVLGGREVCDDDAATTSLTQPAIAVLPDTIVSGASRLQGPAGCVRKAFRVRITGRRIARVRITIDGRAVKTFRNAKGNGRRFVLGVNPGRYGRGIHRLVARVTYSAASETPPRTLRMAFERCQRQAIQPEFTG